MQSGYDNALLKEEVTENEISEIVSKWTGIPKEKEKNFLNLKMNFIKE